MNPEEMSKEELIRTIKSLKQENRFLKAYIRDTKEFKELERRANQ